VWLRESLTLISHQGQSRAELEAALRPEDLAHDLTRPNIGEAALYGVYYDDTSYDYMQHLKPVGVHEAGVENIMLEAPGLKNKGKGKESWVIRDDLPAEALPSKQEMPRTYEHQEAVPSSIAGFQPDLDPHLRQTLEALEDDAFVDDDLEDDFFGELITGGERPKEEDPDFDFDEDGFAEAFAKAARLEAKAEAGAGAGAEGGEDEGWESRFAAFKNAQKTGETAAGPSSDIDEMTEGGDTVGTLPRLPVIGGKRRRKGASDASGYSMSSSSMFRNEGLTSLDERFDQVGVNP
jgi:protein LTV1